MQEPVVKVFIEETGYKGEARSGPMLTKKEGILNGSNRVSRGKELEACPLLPAQAMKGAV